MIHQHRLRSGHCSFAFCKGVVFGVPVTLPIPTQLLLLTAFRSSLPLFSRLHLLAVRSDFPETVELLPGDRVVFLPAAFDSRHCFDLISPDLSLSMNSVAGGVLAYTVGVRFDEQGGRRYHARPRAIPTPS